MAWRWYWVPWASQSCYVTQPFGSVGKNSVTCGTASIKKSLAKMPYTLLYGTRHESYI